MRIDEYLQVPRIGFGTFQLADEAAYRSVGVALGAGYRHIDTAQGYGNEAEVGRAIPDRDVDRDEAFVTTTLWPSNAAAADVHASTDGSLKELGFDHVELLLLHLSAQDVAPLEETLTAMTEVLESGATGPGQSVP